MNPDISLPLFNLMGSGKIVPDLKSQHLPSGWFYNDALTIFLKQKILFEGAIKNKKEFVLRKFVSQSAKNLLHKPSVTFQLALLKKYGVNRDAHGAKLKGLSERKTLWI